MKFFRLSPYYIYLFILCGCDSGSTTAYERLKFETGSSDAELNEAIKSYTKYYTLMRNEIEVGTIKAEDLVDAAKYTKEAMATLQRSDEMTAAMTLAYLRALEQDGNDRALEAMAKQLVRFVEADSPRTESAIFIREKIIEYAKTSPALTTLAQKNEQNAAEQPATAPQSKSK